MDRRTSPLKLLRILLHVLGGMARLLYLIPNWITLLIQIDRRLNGFDPEMMQEQIAKAEGVDEPVSFHNNSQ